MKMDKSKQTLPPKENSLFKRILRCYEQKQYKNGLKFAKLILTNFPNHGETLAMKGLTLNCLGRKEEAYNYVRQGLRNNLMSHVCWHVYGLLQRSDKKYEEAIKCYRNALKWDKDNLQILRDLSLLQIQMRDLDGYKETRYKLFDLRPTQRASWIGYAMSFHLLKDFDAASRILEEFRKTIQKNSYDYEYSELLLYQNMVMRESGKMEDAYEHLLKYQCNICDKVILEELKGELLMSLDRKTEAAEIYRNLISRNPENKLYYLQMEICLNLNTEEEKLRFYEGFKVKYPRAHVPKRLPLNYATGENLKRLLRPYLSSALKKGVTPLFTDIKGLYTDPDRVRLIESLMCGFVDSLRETGLLGEEEEGDFKEPASVLYGWMYLAQHYSYLGNAVEALNCLQLALEHTPTLIELYILKGKILKHAGDIVGACEALQEAQSLDTADRYVNSKAASYLLGAGRVSEAEEMCSKFTREGVSAMENLNEMQCMWFQTECAGAYYRHGQYGLALKKCHEIDRHFTEIIEDQFDFHTYCMRKMTLRSYVQLLRLEDVLRSNRFYWDAAILAIEIYLKLYDEPLSDSDTEKVDTSNMTPLQLKRHKAKQKKALKKAEHVKMMEEKKAELQNKQKHNKSNQNEDMENKPADELIPSKLERPEDPLEDALHFLEPLKAFAAQRIETHIYAFEIYWRKSKPLLMLQSLKRALAIDADFPVLHPCIVRFLKYRQDRNKENKEENKENNENKEEENKVNNVEIIWKVIDSELSQLISTLDPVSLNEAFLNRFQQSAPHRLEASRAMVTLDPVQRRRGIEIASTVDPDLKNFELQHCLRTLSWITEIGDPIDIEKYKGAGFKVYPLATAFKPTPNGGVNEEVGGTNDKMGGVNEELGGAKDNLGGVNEENHKEQS